MLFLISLLTVVVVTVFACGVVVVLLRRGFQRRLDEQKLTVMGSTTARILHQIKNPVQSVLLQAELLDEFERSGAADLRREAGSAILEETQRLAAMLAELSTWAAGSRRTLTLSPVRLHEWLAQLALQERRDASQRGIVVEVDMRAEAVAGVDAYYLRQALENLIRNAQEAMRGQSDGRIRLELARNGSTAVVRVADNGPGIPPEKLGQIFEPFMTTKSSGMGLGLAICREIIEAHGGTLGVQSMPGEGTTFSVQLPLFDGAAAAPEPDEVRNAGEVIR